MCQRVSGPRASALPPQLVDHLFQTPAVTLNMVRQVLGVTQRWASQTAEKLIEVEILQEVSSIGRARLFIAPQILRAIEGLPEDAPVTYGNPPQRRNAIGRQGPAAAAGWEP